MASFGGAGGGGGEDSNSKTLFYKDQTDRQGERHRENLDA